MEVMTCVQKGNTLTARISVKSKSDSRVWTTASPEYIISGSAVVQLKVVSTRHADYREYNHFVFLRFTKRLIDDDCIYTIKFTSKEMLITDKSFTSGDGTWQLLYQNRLEKFVFEMAVQMEIAPSAISFASLHEDTVLTDFELRGEDGSVHMHRAVLAASSPVLLRMLGGEWRETAEGRVNVAGTSTVTMQNFKNYVYLRTLPESGLEDLLLLSSYYMMPDLERRCVDKLVQNLSEANACDMIEFAVKHKLQRLLLATLQHVKTTINVVNMYDEFARIDVK